MNLVHKIVGESQYLVWEYTYPSTRDTIEVSPHFEDGDSALEWYGLISSIIFDDYDIPFENSEEDTNRGR